MANTITGRIHLLTPTREMTVAGTGKVFSRREMVIDATRYDSVTGEKRFDNFPMVEFGDRMCKELDFYNVGDMVTVTFDLYGTEYKDKQTGETRYFTRVRGYRIERAGQPPRQGKKRED